MGVSMNDNNKPVTAGECSRRHNRTATWFTVLISFIAILIVVGSVSATCGFTAKQELRIHQARYDEQMRNMNASLADLKSGMAEQRKMVEDIWRRDRRNNVP